MWFHGFSHICPHFPMMFPHFPVIFPWFSHDFPVKSSKFDDTSGPEYPATLRCESHEKPQLLGRSDPGFINSNINHIIQWIALRENLQETMVFTIK